MRFAKKTDGNHAAVRDGLRQRGYIVRDYSGVGEGVPDLAVLIRPGYSLLLEVKDPKKPPSARRLTEAESEWLTYFGAITRTVLTVDQAVHQIEEYRRELSCMLTRLG